MALPRVVRVRMRPSAEVEQKARLETQVKAAAALQESIAARTDQLKERMQEIERLMKLCGLQTYATHEGDEAFFETPEGRSTTVVDPRLFYNAVGEKNFWSAVTVGVTKAKEVLSGKELERISRKTIPGPKEPVLRVRSRDQAAGRTTKRYRKG